MWTCKRGEVNRHDILHWSGLHILALGVLHWCIRITGFFRQCVKKHNYFVLGLIRFQVHLAYACIIEFCLINTQYLTMQEWCSGCVCMHAYAHLVFKELRNITFFYNDNPRMILQYTSLHVESARNHIQHCTCTCRVPLIDAHFKFYISIY